MPDLSSDCAIIITVHNHIERFGLRCLESVLAHSGNAQVYVYDNESSDPNIEIIRKLADSRPQVEYIRIEDQKSFGGLTGTWNDGIRKAREQGLGRVILLNHDVIVDDTWGNFIQAIESDFCVYGPMTNRPGGGRGPKPQQSEAPAFKGLQRVKRLIGFCMGFTLGRPELKLFDDWRFFNPDLPFGGNEFDIQKRMKMRSNKTRLYMVSDCWVFHHLNRGWKENPRHVDPHDPSPKPVIPVDRGKSRGTRPGEFLTRFNDDNISHILRREILPLAKVDPSELKQGKLYILENKIDRQIPQQKWRAFVLSNIFDQVEYISTLKSWQRFTLPGIVQRATHLNSPVAGRNVNPALLETRTAYNCMSFLDYPPEIEFIRLTEFIKKNAGITEPEKGYVLLNQRPTGNRYLLESNTGYPLEKYLRAALDERGIPFKSCDFSTISPAEQARLCGGAKIFISAHGAGISNIIFTPRDCHVLEYNFRNSWNCDPVCDLHFHGVLAAHEQCNGELSKRPCFHKADFHNLCHLLGRPYTELDVIRYEGFIGRNPITRHSLFVEGVGLLAEIEKRVRNSAT